LEVSYSSLAFSSDTLPRLEPFLGLHASNSTSKMRVELQKQNIQTQLQKKLPGKTQKFSQM
jgi:hypothetical protein